MIVSYVYTVIFVNEINHSNAINVINDVCLSFR